MSLQSVRSQATRSKRTFLLMIIFAIALLPATLWLPPAPPLLAQGQPVEARLAWWTVESGGGLSRGEGAGGSYTVVGAAGQPDAGALAGGTYTLSGGFRSGLTLLPETPEIPETPDNPEIPEDPENPEKPEIPENPETPEAPAQSLYLPLVQR